MAKRTTVLTLGSVVRVRLGRFVGRDRQVDGVVGAPTTVEEQVGTGLDSVQSSFGLDVLVVEGPPLNLVILSCRYVIAARVGHVMAEPGGTTMVDHTVQVVHVVATVAWT